MECKHENFQIGCGVNRLSEIEGGPITHYSADIGISCADCGMKFRFKGLGIGLSTSMPTVSADGVELRCPIGPAETKH